MNSSSISKQQPNRENDDGLQFNKEMVPGGNVTNEGFNLNPNSTMVDPPYQEDEEKGRDVFAKPGARISSEKNNQVTDGSNQDSSANLLQHIDGMAMDVNANNVELIKAALGDNVEAIEITVTPEISQLGNLVKDVEKSLKENAEFKNTMNENYMKNKIELDTRAQTNPVAVVAEDDKKLMVAKRAMKVGVVCIVLLSLVVAFTALLISNASDDPEIWPQTVTYNDTSTLKLNVGGMKDIEVSYTTLVSVPGSKLAQDFTKPQQVEEDGTVFVNRAHFPFRLMLHYLRNSLEIPDIANDQELQLFQQELAYWEIPLRKLTPVEKALVHEFNSKPANPLLIPNVLEQWATLKPFNLYRFIENATIAVPAHYSILDLKRQGVYQWKGQGHQEVGHGVGRDMGGFGLYEGQYFEGVAHGYGRIIWRNRNSYQGYFRDGKADGEGTYSIYSRNVKYSGIWRAGALAVSSYPDSMSDFAIPEPFSPPVRRFQPAAERKLVQLFGQDNLAAIYRTYLDKFPEQGADAYPSIMTARNQQVFFSFARDVAPLYAAKKANLDLTKLLDMEMFDLDPSLRISQIYDTANVYAGQVEAPETSRQLQGLGASKPAGPTLSAHGYGRSFGAWGIYVGQYTRGRVDGYGQMTMKTKNTYRGFTLLGRPQGSGMYTFNNGTVVRGEWKNGTLIVSIRADGREGFTPTDLMIPTCSRVVSQKEIQLNAIFSKAPQFDALPANFSATWSKVGPFDVFGCVGSGDCVPNKAADVVSDPLGVYQGEGGQREGTTYTYNMGIGRYQGYWGMFEGATYQNATKSNLRGRIIWTDGSVYEGYFFFQLDPASGLALDTDQPFSQYGNSSLTLANGTRLYYSEVAPQLKGQNRYQSWKTWTKVVSSKVSNYYYPNATRNIFGPKGYRIIGGNEAKMVRAFESEPKLVSSLVEKQWKLAGVFDLYGLVTNQTIMFDEALAVQTSPDKKYIGQTPKNYTGLGRLQNQFIYEGQFRGALFHGVGRLIAANGTVSSGVFANGAYAARNVTEYQLLQLFARRPSNFTGLKTTNQTQIKTMQSTWSSLGPFALEKYLSAGKMFFAASDVVVFSQASTDAPSGQIVDQGMIGNHAVGAQRLYGIGRRIQTSDVFNENLKKTVPQLQMFEGSVLYQYGRIIFSDGRYFIGTIRFKRDTGAKKADPERVQLPNGGLGPPVGLKEANTGQVVAGNGTMYLPGGTRQIGDIYAGKYRTQYAKERQMLAIFESRPIMKILDASVATTWDKVGPFALEAYLTATIYINSTYSSKGYIKLDEKDMEAAQPQIAEVNTKQFQYHGIVRFGYPSQLDIIGRLGFPWGLYEGAVSNGTFGALQYGRTIYNDGTVYVGYHQADGAPIFGSPLAYNYFVLKDGTNVTSAAAQKTSAPYAGLAKQKVAGQVARKQSAVEVEFLKITNSTLYEYTQSNGAANVSSTLVHPGAYLSYMYKFPIIIEIANFLNAGNITTPDASIPVTKILSEQLVYGGQVDPSTLEVIGVGRLQGPWGLYVGEYYKDKLCFGMLFLKDGYYVGQLKNWRFSGQGTFYKLNWDLSNVSKDNTSLAYLTSFRQGRGKSSGQTIGKTAYTGQWLDNKLVKPAAGSVEVVVNDTVNPILKRPQSQIEKELVKVFKSDLIAEVPSVVKAKWQKLGPFSIYGPISDGTIVLAPLQVQRSVSGRYDGQMNRTGGPQGVGRQQAAWGLHEGVVAGRIANGYGRAIWADGSSFVGTFKNGALVSGVFVAANGTSIPIASAKYKPIPAVPPFMSKTEYELIQLFKSAPTALPTNYASIYKRLGPFALEKYIDTGVVTLIQALKINSLQPAGSYKGQTNAAGTAPEGLGRQFSAATGFYEGEFKDNARNGYGRLITPNGDTFIGNFIGGKYFGFGTLQKQGSASNGKGQTGYFVDGTYIGSGAAAKLEFELMKIFQSPLTIQDSALVNQWKKLGPFDLLSALKAGDLTLDPTVALTSSKNYQGQGQLTKSKASIGRHQSASNVTEGNQGYFPGYLRVIYANQSNYQGGWSNGAPNGKGTKVSASGTVSTGSWKNGQLSGTGSVKYTNGTSMKGTWSKGKLDGQGTVSYSNGTTKTGTWKNGQLAGQGTITYSNGTVAQGSWSAGQLAGQGTVTNKNGLIKKGNWANGQLAGTGTVTQPDGTVRAGTWSNGKLNGSGTVTYKNGTAIAGNWQNGQLSGLGNVTYTNGTIINGYYVKGVYVMSGAMYGLIEVFNSTPTNKPPVPAALVKRWQGVGPLAFQAAVASKKLTLNAKLGLQTKTLNATSSYKGQTIQAKPTPYIGRAVGDGIFEGNFIDGLLNGFGRIIYKNEDWYIGNLKDGLPSGLGNYTFANGTRRDGAWKNGQWQMSLTQYDLQKIFEQTPDYKSIQPNVLKLWQQYGIFNLTKLVNEKKIVIDESLPVSTIEFTTSVYFGQKGDAQMNGVGRGQSTQLQEGLWVNGKLNGYGRVIFDDGRVYEGELKDQVKFGLGTFYFADGRSQTGTWSGAKGQTCTPIVVKGQTGRRGGACRTEMPKKP